MSEVVQGSLEWHQQRMGKATASRISDIVAKTKTGYSTSRANYMAQLVVERMTQTVAESYSNAAMEWGVHPVGSRIASNPQSMCPCSFIHATGSCSGCAKAFACQ